MTRILVTACEPFGREAVNASQQAVRLLPELPQAPGVGLTSAQVREADLVIHRPAKAGARCEMSPANQQLVRAPVEGRRF